MVNRSVRQRKVLLTPDFSWTVGGYGVDSDYGMGPPEKSPDDLKVGEHMKASPQILDDGRVTIVLEKSEQ